MRSVNEPNEVFDTYGRFVGEVFVAMNDRAVSVIEEYAEEIQGVRSSLSE